MKSRNTSIMVFSLSCIVLLLVTSMFTLHDKITYADNTDLATQIKSLEGDLVKINAERAAAQKALNEARSSKASNLALKRQYDNQVIALESLLTTTEELILQYDVSIAETEADIIFLEEQLATQEESFKEMVKMSFMYGNDDYLEMIFDSKDFSDFLSRLDMVSYLLSHNKSVADSIVETEEKLKTEAESLSLAKENLSAYKTSKEVLKTEYEELSAESVELISSAERDEASALSDLESAQKAQKELEAGIAELAKKYEQEKSKNQPYSGGIFIWPVDGNSRTSSGWEWRINPISKKREFHNGLDIPAPRGTKIFAAASGTVIMARWNGGYGNCVVVSHGGGVVTLYGHCNRLNVSEGQTVKQGDVIAFVGTTGYSTGNHLHFTVMENNSTAVNPWNYLK